MSETQKSELHLAEKKTSESDQIVPGDTHARSDLLLVIFLLGFAIFLAAAFIIAQIFVFNSYSVNTADPEWMVYRSDKYPVMHLKAQMDTVLLRYQFANNMLSAATLRRNAAFLVGTLLCLMGALLVVRGIRSSKVDITASFSAQLKTSIASNSPGMILSFFGVVIIVVSLFVGSNLSVDDAGIAGFTTNASDGSVTSVSDPDASQAVQEDNFTKNTQGTNTTEEDVDDSNG